MHIPGSEDDFFPDDYESELADSQSDGPEDETTGDDLFGELPQSNVESSREDLHGEFEGDLHTGLMARVATGGTIKE